MLTDKDYHWFVDLLEAQPPETLKASNVTPPFSLLLLTLFTLFCKIFRLLPVEEPTGSLSRHRP
ncbi:hypothetical protein M9458_020253, partial [Cirrhinus mrigala]